MRLYVTKSQNCFHYSLRIHDVIVLIISRLISLSCFQGIAFYGGRDTRVEAVGSKGHFYEAVVV